MWRSIFPFRLFNDPNRYPLSRSEDDSDKQPRPPPPSPRFYSHLDLLHERRSRNGYLTYPSNEVTEESCIHVITKSYKFLRKHPERMASPEPTQGLKIKDKPTVLLMGMKRSGKSSIAQVVFHKLEAPKTLYLDPTTDLTTESMNSYVNFDILDTPGNDKYFEDVLRTKQFFKGVGAIIFVIDGQDQYYDAFERLTRICLHVIPNYPRMNIEVLVHKMDCFEEEFQNEILEDINTKLQDELNDHGFTNAPVSFYKTSIYDHTIFEVLSRIIQKLLPALPALENLLNTLVAACPIEKIYLIDTQSKISLASDSSPGDIGVYENFSDWINMVVDVDVYYGWKRSSSAAAQAERVPAEEAKEPKEAMMTFEKEGQKALYFKEVDKSLALLMMMEQPSFEQQKALVDYNIREVRKAICDVLKE